MFSKSNLSSTILKNHLPILFPLGNTVSSNTSIHLEYLGITKDHVFFDKEQNEYFLKLSKNKEFNCSKEYSLKYNHTDYKLFYNNTVIAETIIDENGLISVYINPNAMALALNKMDNLLNHPTSYFQGMAEGTIEGCFNEIIHNRCTGFFLDPPHHEVCERFHYDKASPDRILKLTQVLAKNSSLETILLGDISLSKQQLFDLLLAAKNIKKLKKISIYNSYLSIDKGDISDLCKIIKNMDIDFDGTTIAYGQSLPELIAANQDKDMEDPIEKSKILSI